jgi:hypothetical protein
MAESGAGKHPSRPATSEVFASRGKAARQNSGVNPTTLASRLKALGINKRDYLRSA